MYFVCDLNENGNYNNNNSFYLHQKRFIFICNKVNVQVLLEQVLVSAHYQSSNPMIVSSLVL